MRNNTIDEGFFDDPTPPKKEYFWQHFEERPIFCGFGIQADPSGDKAKDKKIPTGLDGVAGISADSKSGKLGTYAQAKELGTPYMGISLNHPVKLGDLYLVCLDFDWKKSLTDEACREQIDMMAALEGMGCAYEASYSGSGAHFWVLCKEENLVKSWKIGPGYDIEVFSGFYKPRKNVLITDYDVMGELKEVNLKELFPAQPEFEETEEIKADYTSGFSKDDEYENARKMLGHIPPEGYDDIWIPVGMALKHTFGDAGFELWDNWSKQGSTYDPNVMRVHWDSIKGETAKPVTMATLAWIAKQYGYRHQHKKSSPWEDFGEVDMETGELVFAEASTEKKPNPWLERVREISQQLIPPNWVIDGILADKMTMIAGSPGVGKTSCLVPLALAVAGIKSHLSDIKSTYNRKVIYVTEDKWQIDSIIHGIIKHMLLDDGTKVTYEMIAERFIVVETMKSKIPELIQLADIAADYVVNYEATNGIKKMMPLFVLDTSSATFSMDDENDNSEASKYVAAIKENFISKDIPVWIVAHTAKAHKRAEVAALSVRGAGAFEGDANCVAYLISEEGVDSRFFVLGKHRYAARFKEIAIDSVVHQEVSLNAYGDPEDVFYRYSTLERSSEGDRMQAKEEAAAEREVKKEEIFKEKVFGLVINNPAMTLTELIVAVGGKQDVARDSIKIMLELGELKQVFSGKKSGNNKEIFYIQKGF